MPAFKLRGGVWVSGLRPKILSHPPAAFLSHLASGCEMRWPLLSHPLRSLSCQTWGAFDLPARIWLTGDWEGALRAHVTINNPRWERRSPPHAPHLNHQITSEWVYFSLRRGGVVVVGGVSLSPNNTLAPGVCGLCVLRKYICAVCRGAWTELAATAATEVRQ